MAMNKIQLSKDDKELFYNEAQKLSAVEFVQLTKELDMVKDRFTKSSWKWICSVLGKRAYKYLKNAVKNHSFEETP